MTTNEVGDLLDKIKLYRPYFAGHLDKTGLSKLKREWFEKLEPYDVEDINNKLDEFLKDGDNLNKQPDVYQLMKRCKTIREKTTCYGVTTSCKFCGRWFSMENINIHQDRCRSIRYLKKLYSEFFPDRELPLRELYEKSDEDFNSDYEKILDVIYPRLKDEEDRKWLENVIKSRTEERRFDLQNES